MRAIKALQLDPLNVVARAHDIMLWGRVEAPRPGGCSRCSVDELAAHKRFISARSTQTVSFLRIIIAD